MSPKASLELLCRETLSQKKKKKKLPLAIRGPELSDTVDIITTVITFTEWLIRHHATIPSHLHNHHMRATVTSIHLHLVDETPHVRG
jgi:hypothetical protein